MIFASLRPLGRALRILCGGATPHEIALGVALGLMLGLVPKSNLTAVTLCGVILCLRLNLYAAGMTTLAIMPLAASLDGVGNSIGMYALSCGPLAGFWTWLFRQPLVPWLQLND